MVKDKQDVSYQESILQKKFSLKSKLVLNLLWVCYFN